MQVDPHTAPGSAARMLGWAHDVFVAVGLAALAWCAALLTDAYVAQQRARVSLDAMASVETPLASENGPLTATLPGEVVRREEAAAPPALPFPRTAPAPRRPTELRGSPLAELFIPRVNLSAMVLQGTDAHTLYVGVGHIENTAWPGEPGNVGLAGHRDTFFRPLRNIQMGDEVFLDVGWKRVQYRVSSIQVVTPDNVSVLGPTDIPTLTLVTCFPFTFVGHAADRFVVRASRVAPGLDPSTGVVP